MKTPTLLQDMLLRVGISMVVEYGNGGFLAELRDPESSLICCSSLCDSIEGAIRSLEWKLKVLRS